MSTKTSAQSHSTGATTNTTTTATTTSTKIATSTTTTATTVGISTTASTSSTTMQAVKIKKELPSDEIKEFAENTMNELLGWYGFDGVDRLDLSAKTSRLLQTAAASANNAMSQHHMEKRRSRSRAVNFFQMQQNEHLRNIANNNNNNNNNSANNNNNNNNSRKGALNCNNNRGSNRHESSSRGGGGGGGGNDSTTSDHDTRSSREDDSKSPHSAGKTTMEEKIDFLNCCWCRRLVPENAPEFLTTTDGPRYCSESCFTQSRRASFKKAKTCDWCKHVRHAVSYVDFQDGASQLQFCSDKCLNQYKMQIFCKETQAHLDMNPHLRDQGMEAAAAGNGAGLITPDLWLRNCRSRSASPASTVSVSPGPPAVLLPNMSGALTTSSSSPRITPPSCSASTAGSAAVPASSSSGPHKPMISVAPVSKLMSKSAGLLSSSSSSNRQSPKHNRKKRPLRSCVSAAAAGDLSAGLKSSAGAMTRGELNALGTANTSASILAKSKVLLGANASSNLRSSPGHMVASNAAAGGKSTASSLSQFAGSSVQDLHMSVPPLSPMLEQQSHPHPHPHQHALSHMANVGGRGGTSIPPAFFATPSSGQPPQAAPPPSALSHAAFAPHPPFLPNAAAAAAAAAAAGLLPRFLGAGGGGGGFAGMQQPPPPPHLLQPHDLGGLGLGALLGAPPPVTVMVPYPIIIPLPIPIPIPLPVMDFYKAHLTPEERAKLKEREAQQSKSAAALPAMEHADEESAAKRDCEERGAALTTQAEDTSDEPLDFTKSKESAAAPQPNAQTPKSDNDVAATASLDDESTAPVSVKRAVSEERDATTPTPLGTPLSDDAPSPTPKHVKEIHYIVCADDELSLLSDAGRREAHPGGDNAPPDESADGSDDAKQKLPKFKITRLQTKRTLIQTKEATAECSRPLRKRKRIIDCDFQKIALKDADAEADASHREVANTTPPTATTACKAATGGKRL